MKKTLFVLVNNEAEVLMRVAGLLRRKGIQIKNISMDEIENSQHACLSVTFTLEDSQRMPEIYYSLDKLEDVLRIEEINNIDLIKKYYQLGIGRMNEMKLAFNF